LEGKIKLEILGLSSSQSQTGSFALILGEVSGIRRLPIIIGMFEAQAIAIEIEEIAPNRPMTHDLFKNLASQFDIKVKEIYISDLKEGVFFAHIVTEQNSKIVVLDARPSDAIALALRFGVPIFSNEQILSKAGIIISDDESIDAEVTEEGEELIEKVSEIINEDSHDFDDCSNEDLQSMLTKSLSDEDYEEAARIRDELNKRTS
jgi:hypothetical protein